MAKRSSVTAGQYHSRILWQNAAALPQDSTVAKFCGGIQQQYSNVTATLRQDSTVAEFCGRIQQRYSKTVPQQNSVAKCSNVTAGQYRSRILWQNTATLQQDSAVAEFCTAM
nr:hypothetical protein CFP56_35680 [Quercus suber]